MNILVKEKSQSKKSTRVSSALIADSCLKNPYLIMEEPISINKLYKNINGLKEKLRASDKPQAIYGAGTWGKYEEYQKASPNWMPRSIQKDFKELEYSIIKNSIVDNPVQLTERHVNVICELCDYTPNTEIFTELCVIHSYLCASYVTIDLIFDGQIDNKNAYLDVAPILLAVQNKVFKILEAYSSQDRFDITTKLKESLLVQRMSLLEEEKFRKNSLLISENEEYESVIGKADCVLFMVELCSLLNNKIISETSLLFLKTYLFLSQLADDLSDWREDLINENYTSILRQCFASKNKICNEYEIEECLYLEGIYESRLVKIINIYDKINSNLRGRINNHPLTLSIVSKEREMLFTVLTNFIETKNTFLRG